VLKVPPLKTVKFAQFIDLLLARLYELESNDDRPYYFDLDEIAHTLTVEVPRDWVFDAGKVLEGRGLADCIFTFGGVSARLTGEGRLFVEEKRGTGIISEYQESPSTFVIVSGNQNEVSVGRDQTVTQTSTIEKERAAAFELLDEIQRTILAANDLTEQERQELISDTDAVRGQLRKREPNRVALAALLQPLSAVSSIAGLVASLIKILNP
jgi:hypothetical protein